MSNKPLVTIVIPVFNGEKYIREAIESALGQTYENIEIIVVDDGSIDHTAEICSSFGAAIRYVYKTNGGVASAVNLGIKMMRGEYFSWLSHDDVYYPNKIERQIEIVLSCGDRTNIVHGNYDIYNESSGLTTHIRHDKTYTAERMEDSVFPLLVTAFQGCVPLVHKSHFECVGVFDESLRLTQDYDFFFRAMRGKKTIFIDEPLVMVRMHREAGRVINADFGKECGRQYLTFMNTLSADEIRTMFADESIFYYRTAGMAAARGLEDEALQIIKSIHIKNGIQEENLFGIRIAKMIGKEMEHILIYGAGFQGRLLAYELRGRGCLIEAFIDRNELLCGREIDGIICINPNALKDYDRKNLIIVSPDDSGEIVSRINNMGFEEVITKKDIEKILLETNPYHYQQIVQMMEDALTPDERDRANG